MACCGEQRLQRCSVNVSAWSGAPLLRRAWCCSSSRPRRIKQHRGNMYSCAATPDSSVCPVHCLQRLCACTPVGSLPGPVFGTHQHSLQPLRKATMLTRLHHRLQSLGLPSELFGLHSLRSGGALLLRHSGTFRRDSSRSTAGGLLINRYGGYSCAVPADRWATSVAIGQTAS